MGCGNNQDGILGAIFLQATFPGIAGVYYGDEVGLGGADDPFNREPFPWHNEESWNKTILEFTKTMMQIKNVNPIFKYGHGFFFFHRITLGGHRVLSKLFRLETSVSGFGR